MRNSATIELIGYVYQDAKHPNENDYPNWVVFKMCVRNIKRSLVKKNKILVGMNAKLAQKEWLKYVSSMSKIRWAF